jgi:hypothetical protein
MSSRRHRGAFGDLQEMQSDTTGAGENDEWQLVTYTVFFPTNADKNTQANPECHCATRKSASLCSML